MNYGNVLEGNLLNFSWLHLISRPYIDPDEIVAIVNYLHGQAESGQTIFYDIYTDEEKARDPRKQDTGLFFFRGNKGARFAVCNAGGAFAYVGAMHDSFPHALQLSKKGYNAFALIYRLGRRPLARTWRAPSVSSSRIRTNWESTPTATRFGAVRQVDAWHIER